MENIELEKKCRVIAKSKSISIRKKEDCISLSYKVTIRKQGRIFHSWEEVLQFVENFKS